MLSRVCVQVYRKTCPTGLVWLGGNGAKGSRGAKRGYFVFVHVAERSCTVANSPPPTRPMSLPLHRSRTGTNSGTFDDGGHAYGSGRPPVAATSITPTWGARQRFYTFESSPARSRSSTFVSDAAPDSEAIAEYANEGDDAIASAKSSPRQRPLSSIRRSTGSRSFQSLENFADTSGLNRGGDGGGDGGSDGGDGGGGVRAVSLSGGEADDGDTARKDPGQDSKRSAFGPRRRRGMSTADAEASVVPMNTWQASTRWSGGTTESGGRARAWTGGEGSVWTGSGEIDMRGGRRAHGSDACGSRKATERSGGLQRISALWDSEKDGPLSQIPVPFDRIGRRWSRKFNVDAANTAGPLETSGATLGVSVSALTGQFHRTRVVTLYPRLIVRNFLGIPLEVSQ